MRNDHVYQLAVSNLVLALNTGSTVAKQSNKITKKNENGEKVIMKVTGVLVVEGNHNGVNVRPSVDKHHPTVVTWADVVREK